VLEEGSWADGVLIGRSARETVDGGPVTLDLRGIEGGGRGEKTREAGVNVVVPALLDQSFVGLRDE
jgi:hypothetical protein